MSIASRQNSSIINASFAEHRHRADRDAARAQRSNTKLATAAENFIDVRVPFEEQFKYRFLPVSAPPHTVSGRILVFLRSNSLVVKFTMNCWRMQPCQFTVASKMEFI
ncbi:unnamed protein product [Polarella glacialis]|uniref:Uncharacterized protein n=1 Tax=Polarella glacialis TaxID=89957 RepID=A0A813KAX6_POLGL|nr:unnamed protein product [Polarella glacialis]